MNVRLTLSDPSVKGLAKASCSNTHYNNLPKLLGEANWQQWSDALQHAALMAGADALLNGESKHPPSLDEQQSTTAEWNDNIRRIAVWRSRNESLLKAMRKASGPGVDLNEFGSLNAHDTYLRLKSSYHTSSSQRAFHLFHEEFIVVTDLDDPPRDAANDFQVAFNRYNHLVGHNTEQRLPENFLKMAFLSSLDDVYDDWRKALLKEQNVLALDQGSTLTFNELVDLVITEHTRLLQERTDRHVFESTKSSQQPAKRNISKVDEPTQPDLHAPCSLPHHKNAKHTNQKCKTQNPRLRPKNWTASVQDREYLAEHPEIENPHSDDSSHDDLGSDESDSEAEDVEHSKHVFDVNKDNGSWRDTALTCYKKVKAQMDTVTAGFDSSGNIPRKYPTVRGDLTGEWLLYSKEYNPGTGGHHRIRLWDTTPKDRKRLQPNNQHYGGRLTIGPRGKAETFEISSFLPSYHVTGRYLQINLTQAGRKSRGGEMTFWGDGNMVVTIPAPVIGDSSGKLVVLEFAGLKIKHALRSAGARAQTKPDSSDDSSESGSSGDSSDDEERYDRVIRTDKHASVAIKVEKDENTSRVRGAEEAIESVAIKAEQFYSSDFDDE
ncbi:hypothetical protein KCU67_g6374, partial [Aureobasidium melanogenum]